MIFYSVYGLAVRSNYPVPGLPEAPSSMPDVDVIWGKLPEIGNASGRVQISSITKSEREHRANLTAWQCPESGYLLLTYRDGTKFAIDQSGTQVWTTWPDALTLDDTATYLLGPVLGFMLRLRGVLCLHASGIAIDERGIAFVGPPGAGKSTLAAAFAESGFAVLSDDVLPLLRSEFGFVVQPGYPRLRLWPEAVRALYGAPDALPPITANWDKRHLDLTSESYLFQSASLPLGAIYLLDERTSDSTAPIIEPVKPRDAFVFLVANTYANYLLDATMREKEFSQLQWLVATIPVRRVRPHADPRGISELRAAILFDALEVTCTRESPGLDSGAAQTGPAGSEQI